MAIFENLVRKPSQYEGASPNAIASGSKAQMMYFVEDAKKDIALLLSEGERTARNRDMWKGQCERQAEELTRLHEENARLKKQIAAASTWFWPEGDTSSECCRDNPREVFEDMPAGDIAPYSCGGVVYTNWYGWLPPVDDADSDDEFEVDEATEELATAKMQAEQDRRSRTAADKIKKELPDAE